VNNRTADKEVGLMSLFVISLILTDYRVSFNAVAKVTAVFLAVAVGIHARRESPTYEAHHLSRAYLHRYLCRRASTCPLCFLMGNWPLFRPAGQEMVFY
jgi:hypothetical protein